MKKLIFLLLITLTLNCCDDDDSSSQDPIDQLPPETQTGENTFAYLLNGELVNITNTPNQFAIYQGGGVQFGGGGVFIVALDPFDINITYQFMDISEGTSRARYTSQVSENTFCLYEYGDTYEGYVRFTNIDTENFIISGTFEYSTIREGCQDINITNGRFDLQYIP
ncbi:MAG: hypothetical protein HRU50_00035 [Winogradskyella sp.]|uniref:hypothetical protein n=1 Tax=Winogradskyella sp. TaxID=1883156 RepID=UPI0025F9920C|nr:hypothetical protein [Winogradskyella sp.]NRB58309.1 hypothetical protein [Winogradskyella sp.]